MTYHTHSEEETIALGQDLARGVTRELAVDFASGGVVLLKGNLGAGKTALAKGILQGLGVATIDEVTSPTFTLIHEYGGAGKPMAYHIDLYRLETPREVAGLGLDEMIGRGGLLLIEWGERFPHIWPARRVEIDITPGDDPDSREIRVTQLGETSA